MIALLIDIGNSRIKWRIAHIDPGKQQPRWLTDERALASFESDRISAAFAVEGDTAVETVFCSNVASEDAETAVRDAVSRIWRDAPVRSLRASARQCGVVNGYRDPTQLGPDRWLAMIGAHVRFPDRTLLVCGFGTATTVDLLVASRDPAHDPVVRFVGGLILPGFDAMRCALVTTTARLPMSEGHAVDFADNTDDAIASGVAAAQVGAVERAWRTIRRASGPATREPAMCLLAGGNAATVEPLLADLDVAVEVVHDLVLLGMAAVASDTAGAAFTTRASRSTR